MAPHKTVNPPHEISHREDLFFGADSSHRIRHPERNEVESKDLGILKKERKQIGAKILRLRAAHFAQNDKPIEIRDAKHRKM